VTVLDKRDLWNRRNEYAVRVAEEQDAFAAGVDSDRARAWRTAWQAGNFAALDPR
jgi:hypothetical protein